MCVRACECVCACVCVCDTLLGYRDDVYSGVYKCSAPHRICR